MEAASPKAELEYAARQAQTQSKPVKESNPIQDTWDNAVPSFNNAMSYDTADQKQSNGQPADGVGSTLGSLAGTTLRTGIAAGVGAGLGSVVPGAGTLGGGISGALGSLGVGAANSRLHQQVQNGEVHPTSSNFFDLPDNIRGGYYANAAAPLASATLLPGAKGLLPNATLNAGVGAGTDAINQAIDKGGIDKVDFGQTASAGAEGAAFGSLQHLALGGLGKLIGANKAGGNPLEPNYGEGQLPPSLQGNATPQGPSTEGGKALEGRLPPIGVGQSSQQQAYDNLLKEYAAEHHFFPRSKPTLALETKLADFGVDPKAALDEYLTNLHAKEMRTFSTGYEPNTDASVDNLMAKGGSPPRSPAGYQANLTQSMDNTVNQAHQDQGQNVRNTLQGISNYDPSIQTPGVTQAIGDQNQNAQRTLQATAHYSEGQSPETPYADQGAQYGQVGPEQSGIDLQDVLRQLHEGTIDLHDVQDWLDSQDQQNLQLKQMLGQGQQPNVDFTQPKPGQPVTQQALQGQAQQLQLPIENPQNPKY